jgi:hypothetical protein
MNFQIEQPNFREDSEKLSQKVMTFLSISKNHKILQNPIQPNQFSPNHLKKLPIHKQQKKIIQNYNKKWQHKNP